MRSIWVESLGRAFDQALDLLATAVQDCPDELWKSGMWEVRAEEMEFLTDPVARSAYIQRRSTPWSVAWHALETLDYDLTGELGPWAPPAPFVGNPHWQVVSSMTSPAWSRSEMLDYTDYCRQRVSKTLADMTDERAATPLPSTHRRRGHPYAWIITDLVGHTIEHGSQIRQFITAAGISPAGPA